MKLNQVIMVAALFSIVLPACVVPPRNFKNTPQPSAPDYTKSKYWAALPDKKDSADFELLNYGIIDKQATAKADVFFITPTNYLSGLKWNVSVDDSAANAITDNISCKFLASAFNGSCKVYVPRYRTAILYSYFATDKNARRSFALAYKDVKTAFLYYLKHYNRGRPIVLASHSQGTDYAITLMKEFFDKDTVLKKQLVEAYIIGRPVYDTTFKLLTPSYTPTHTGGFVVWNTVSYHTNTFYSQPVGKVIGVNPLSWNGDTTYVPASYNKGGLPFTAKHIDTALVDAKLATSGFLWVHKPDKPAKDYPALNSFYYHKDDYNFFYMNIRHNVDERIKAYFQKHSSGNK